MNHIKPVVDVDQVLANIDQLLKEIREGIDPKQLTVEDRASLFIGFDKLATEAYKCKMILRISEMEETNPNATTREALVYAIGTLPNDLSANMLAALAKYVAEKWEGRVETVAA